MKSKNKHVEFILKAGKPSAVIIPLDEYRDMIERLGDKEDIEVLNGLTNTSL
ncbi:MAG: hypothetical protein SVY53_10030 [Chloroflexota bacterium]|nr:hypothetical protein [Chloroflexota bacterium]